MGILGFRKKEQSSQPVQQDTTPTNTYDPWDSSHGYSTADYSTAVFLYWLSLSPRAIGPTADAYPRYISYELSVHDPIKRHQELLREGFLRNATQLEVLETFKVAELKELLALYGFQGKGKKADLITAITTSINPVALQLPQMYCVSEKGLAFMEANEDYIKLHGNPYSISYKEFIEAKQEASPYLKYNDLIWFIFNRREMSFDINAYGLKRNNELHRAMFLKSENRREAALYQYIVVLYYDVHDACFDEVLPYIKEQIQDLKECYSDTLIEKCYNTRRLPNSIPMDAFKYIVNGILHEQ